MKILIDNGHGARDNTKGKYSPVLTGMGLEDATIYNGRFREGNFNRLVAKDIVAGLKAKGYDASLIVPEDADISLGERVRRVNKICEKEGKSNVILVSVHANALGHAEKWYSADFWSVWTTKGRTKSDILATCLYDACKAVMPERKFGKQMADGDVDYEENFYILRKTLCPAVLTENFFYTNKENLLFLASPEGRRKIAQGHINGIIDYLKG